MKFRIYIFALLLLAFFAVMANSSTNRGGAAPVETSPAPATVQGPIPILTIETLPLVPDTVKIDPLIETVGINPIPAAPPLPSPSDKPVALPVTVEDWYGVPPEDLPERIKGLYIPTVAEVKMAAQMTHGESRGIQSVTEQAADVWCALNRVDTEGYGMGRSLTYVLTFPSQFHGYSPYNPTVDDYGRDLAALAADVITRWLNEKHGFTDAGRVLPKEYLYFCSDGRGHNVFRTEYHSSDPNCRKWNWALPSPYES